MATKDNKNRCVFPLRSYISIGFTTVIVEEHEFKYDLRFSQR
jgi:hypothetical protein